MCKIRFGGVDQKVCSCFFGILPLSWMDDEEEVDIQYISLRFLYRELLWLHAERLTGELSESPPSAVVSVQWHQPLGEGGGGVVTLGVSERESHNTTCICRGTLIWTDDGSIFSTGEQRKLKVTDTSDPSSLLKYLPATSLHVLRFFFFFFFSPRDPFKKKKQNWLNVAPVFFPELPVSASATILWLVKSWI